MENDEIIEEMDFPDSHYFGNLLRQNDPLNWVKAARKLARSHWEEIKDMVSEFSSDEVVLQGANLSVAQVAAVARRAESVKVWLDDATAKARVTACADWVVDNVMKGTDMYGITTGFGANSHRRTAQGLLLQNELIRFLNAGIFPGSETSSSSAQSLSPAATRAAMLVRINTLLQGFSGIRWVILEALRDLLNAQLTPIVPLRGTITASGDLMPLSYIAGVLIGRPNARVRTADMRVISAVEAMAQIRGGGEGASSSSSSGGEEVRANFFELQPKEGLALVNGTAVGAGLAACVCYDANVMCLLAEVMSALFCEVMHGKREFADAFTHKLKHHPGQIEAGAIMHHLLSFSPILSASDSFHLLNPLSKPKQDRYALRTSPQWLGPQIEAIRHATHAIQREINSVNDNPLIDMDRNKALHGGNFQGTPIGVYMDTVKLSIAAVGKLMFAQMSELVNDSYNNGLPSNLSGGPDPSLDYGFKGAEIAMASYMSELAYLAEVVTTHVQSAEQHNQDVNSLGLIAARKAEEALDILALMSSTFLVALCQAVDLRHLEDHFRVTIKGVVIEAADKAGLNEDIKEELVQEIEGIAVFSYIDDATNDQYPLIKKVRDVFAKRSLQLMKQKIKKEELVREMLETKLDLELLREGKINSEEFLAKHIVDKEGIERKFAIFEEELRAKLTLEVPLARQRFDEGNPNVPNKIEQCATFPLYNLIRRELGTVFLSGTHITSPGEQFDKVFEAIKANKLVGPLLKCIEGWNGAP